MEVVVYNDEAGRQHPALVIFRPGDAEEADNPPIALLYVDPDTTDSNGYHMVTRRAEIAHESGVTQPDNEDEPRVPFYATASSTGDLPKSEPSSSEPAPADAAAQAEADARAQTAAQAEAARQADAARQAEADAQAAAQAEATRQVADAAQAEAARQAEADAQAEAARVAAMAETPGGTTPPIGVDNPNDPGAPSDTNETAGRTEGGEG